MVQTMYEDRDVQEVEGAPDTDHGEGGGFNETKLGTQKVSSLKKVLKFSKMNYALDDNKKNRDLV